MKAVIYARYSSDKQSENSIDDQIRNCERYLERHFPDYKIDECYEDRAVSGSFRLRPEYQRMLKAAEAKEFQLLLVDDLSRLNRDDVEMKTTLRRLSFWGIQVIGVSDAYDSQSKGHKIQAGMRGLMNELYLDDLREKTHRGMTGQALRGFHTGGRTYGYKHVPIFDEARQDPFGRPLVIAVKREVDPDQAAVIVRIYQWFAAGYTTREIADFLNSEKIRSPRGGTWAASAIYGHVKEGTGILCNELYIGKVRWNRSKWIKDPDTGARRRRPRDESEVIYQEQPELRIVPQELWEQVRARQLRQHQKSEESKKNLHINARTGAGPKYLLSGLLKCGECGGNYVVMDRLRYGCCRHKERGTSVCKNNLKVERSLIEERLLSVVKHHLFTPECIELFRKEVSRRIAEREGQKDPELEMLKRRLSVIKSEMNNLMTAIKAGITTKSTKAELEKLEEEKSRLTKLVEANTKPAMNINVLLPRLVDSYKDMVRNIEKTTQPEVNRLRHRLSLVMGEQIVLRPETNDGEKHLAFEVAGDFGGLMKAVDYKGKMYFLTHSIQ